MNFSMLRQLRNTSLFLQPVKAPRVLEPAKFLRMDCFTTPALSPFQIVIKRWKMDDRRALTKATPLKDMGTQGEKQLDVDLLSVSKDSVYPDADTPDLLFDGVRFADLPICHIRSSKNNTIMQVTDAKGICLVYRSCGLEGFKNTRKGTNIAAQTTAVTISGMAKKKGIVNLRVKIQGLGPGRMSAIKGLQMSGMNIVSVTDCTPISFTPPRPRKARRL